MPPAHTLQYKVNMNAPKRTIAAAEVLLIFPAALFMAALFVRNVTPQPNEPAYTAQRIVMWYAAWPHVGLWLLLIALPLAVLIIGCATLLQSWSSDAALREAARQSIAAIRAHFATLLTAAATAAAGAILAVVAVHVLTD